jgi:hypothetical protein
MGTTMSLTDTFLEIQLTNNEDFLKVKETLTRIGIASRKEKKLYQSCHILHKRGKYYLVHFKELFLLDGKQSDFTEEDMSRRNAIAHLLEEWGLLLIVSADKYQEPKAKISSIKIIPFKEKKEWILESKYTIGKKKLDQ